MPTTARDGSEIDSQNHIEIPDWFDEELRSDLINKINRKRGLLSFVDTLVFSSLAMFHRGTSAWRYTEPYGWAEIERIIEEDCQQIRDSEFSPDIVVGIKSGGAFIARFVSGCIGVSDVDYVRVDRYRPVLGGAFLAVVFKYFREAQLTPSSSVDLSDKRVLLVDDQIRSGKSLGVARRWVKEQGAAEVKTFCLFTQGAQADFGNRPGIMMNSPWGDDP